MEEDNMGHHENKHEHTHAKTSMHDAEHGSKCGKCGKHHKSYTKLCPLSLGIAAGLVNGLSILLFAWLGSSAHMQAEAVRMMGVSGIWGAVLSAFITGFLAALVFGLFYNSCLCCFKSRFKCGKCKSHCCKC